MEIVSWNIQNGRGVDGTVDLRRIAEDIRAFSTADVICLQEVARHCPELDDGQGADQVAILAEQLPGYSPFFGAVFDRVGPDPGVRRQFGNLVMSRVPPLQVFRHMLPNPADPGVPRMPRQAIEVVVESPSGAFRVVTTHLAYHSSIQRLAQVKRLRGLTAELAAETRKPAETRPGTPFETVAYPVDAVFCGDFNMVPGSAEYDEMVRPFDDGTPAIRDAWSAIEGARPHDPTCGLFDRVQWSEGPDCRDFFFVTDNLTERLEAIDVNPSSASSDHQPLKLRLAP